MNGVLPIARAARKAAAGLAAADTKTKNGFLTGLAAALEQRRAEIIAENARDTGAARKGGMSDAFIDRLTITDAVIDAMANGVRQVAALPDPVGAVLDDHAHPNGMRITKVTVPFGVVGIIFESRPNVAVDAGALCIKAGNAVILRGGAEAAASVACLVSIMRACAADAGLDENVVCCVEDTSRQSARDMMELKGYIDLLIPRGGRGLIEAVTAGAAMPVIATGVGNCHIYVDSKASPDMAVAVVYNAKTSRPSTCNAAETLLVAADAAPVILPKICSVLELAGVALRGDEQTRRLVRGVAAADEEDYYAEYNDYILAVKVVRDVDEAIEHINKYGSHHSDAIITDDDAAAERFLASVDSAAVYRNASTRFTDGFEFGLGAEIGISTQKLHARGPMGLKELTTVKYIVRGDGQIR